MAYYFEREEQVQSPQPSPEGKIRQGTTRRTSGQKPSLNELLYCLNCVSKLGSKVEECVTPDKPGPALGQEDEPHVAKIHKIRCGCGKRFWKLAEWERHEMERGWEAPTESHLAQCEKCRRQMFERREYFVKVFKPLLDQEAAETYGKYRHATEKVNIAATDPDPDPDPDLSFITRVYPSTAIDPDPTDGTNAFRGLVSFGEDRFVYEEKGYIQMALKNHRCRYISPEDGLLTEPTLGPQDGSFITRYFKPQAHTSGRDGTFVERRQEKRELPESEVDSFEFDVPDSKRMRADPRVYLDMVDTP